MTKDINPHLLCSPALIRRQWLLSGLYEESLIGYN